MDTDKILIKSALISVYDKTGLETLIKQLHSLSVTLFSTGGTEKFILELGVPVKSVEELTSYPSILGGRVKTLHPKVFGGILGRREDSSDAEELAHYEIPTFDLVIVDLYPFQETVRAKATKEEIIEKIDIGGISLIRAGAKNFKDVCIISSKSQYSGLENILTKQKGESTYSQRKQFASEAFLISSTYDRAIFEYFDSLHVEERGVAPEKIPVENPSKIELRYGENPHQKGYFEGDFFSIFEKLHGKELSYNNMVDMDAGIRLVQEFDEPTFAILKHNNPCGFASSQNILNAWKSALACDPVSAFGGVLISNRNIDIAIAHEINPLFFEVFIAPSFESEALKILEGKKNRILLVQKHANLPETQFKSLLNGIIYQDSDLSIENIPSWKLVTTQKPSEQESSDLLFALRIVKHTKSNAIVLAKNNQMIGVGVGQTSRVDALYHALAKARHFGFELNGAVMASDAFFPFPDCVEIAAKAGIKAIIQPGGSIKDQDSIQASNLYQVSMVFSAVRHFKH